MANGYWYLAYLDGSPIPKNQEEFFVDVKKNEFNLCFNRNNKFTWNQNLKNPSDLFNSDKNALGFDAFTSGDGKNLSVITEDIDGKTHTRMYVRDEDFMNAYSMQVISKAHEGDSGLYCNFNINEFQKIDITSDSNVTGFWFLKSSNTSKEVLSNPNDNEEEEFYLNNKDQKYDSCVYKRGEYFWRPNLKSLNDLFITTSNIVSVDASMNIIKNRLKIVSTDANGTITEREYSKDFYGENAEKLKELSLATGNQRYCNFNY